MTGVPSSHYGLSLNEYRALLLGNVDDFLDEQGRPIGEVRASAEVRAGTRTEYRLCPYAGSRGRSGLPMNLSALRQAAREWNQVLGTLDLVRAAYLERYPCNALTLLEFARIAAAGLLLPAYLLFRASDGISDGRLPVFVAATHKMLAGLFSVSKNLLLCQVAMGSRYDQVPADALTLFKFAETSNMLVGKTGAEVCAGSPGMIGESLNLLAHGTWKTEPDTGALRALLPDSRPFLDYAAAVGDLMLWGLVFGLRARELVEALRAQLACFQGGGPGGEPRLARVAAGLADFETAGFGAQTLPFRGLEPDAAEAMIQGVMPLLRDLRAEETVGALFERAPMATRAEAPVLVAWLRGTGGGRGWPSPALDELGATLARCLRAEREGLRMFERFQASIHRALGRMPPSPETGTTLTVLFGPVASGFFAEVLGIEIQTSADVCVLTDGSRQLCLR